MQRRKTISLVLGSGGARGLAHIGIIHWLEENGFDIRSVAGSSMGALIGGIYAADKLSVYEEWVRGISKFDILTLLDISLTKGGLVKGDRIIQELENLVGERRIEDLPISFTAVATDITREREVWINKGPLFDAIRASISLPLFFTPFEIDGVKLIDGGVLNPVPIAPTFDDGTNLTIAVNLGGPPDSAFDEPRQAPEKKEDSGGIKEAIASFIDSLTDLVTESSDKTDWGMFFVADKSFDAMQTTIARQKLAAYPPDILIEIPRNACGTLEFDRADEMIALGRRTAAERLLPHLVDPIA